MLNIINDIVAYIANLFLAWPLWGQVVAVAGGFTAVFGSVSQARNLYRWLFVEPGERRRQTERDDALRSDA